MYGPGWTEWHDCPSGQLMTGVRVYRYEDKWFTGISAISKYRSGQSRLANQ